MKIYINSTDRSKPFNRYEAKFFDSKNKFITAYICVPDFDTAVEMLKKQCDVRTIVSIILTSSITMMDDDGL